MERALILGASRGLGAELVRCVADHRFPVVGYGRKEERLKALREKFPLFSYHVADFSKPASQEEALRDILTQNYSKIFYVAGGGPFGPYQAREWKDHEWAWQVSFQFPARLMHLLLATDKPPPQVVLVGSSVAESAPDPNAASYCAAKHALRGLFMTLKGDNPSWDLRLFSPGYMDTELLPQNAPVRAHGVYSPAQLAEELWLWSLTVADDSGHKVYPTHPI